MPSIELLVLLLALAAALQVLAQRTRTPQPVLLVLAGLALAFIPGLPRVRIAPQILFVVFVPPLLYRAAVTTSLRDFREEAGAITRLGVLLVLVTIGGVAWVAHTIIPEFTWPAAFVLGAIVSPPDPIAAIAVLRTLNAPTELTSILEGEGMVNDATALVAYRLAVGAAVTGAFSIVRAGEWFLLAAAGGIAIGFAVGWLIVRVRRLLSEMGGVPVVENTISLLTPFAAYLPADRLNASGVLAVVTVGLYLGRAGPKSFGAATRVQGEAMWSMATFLLESLIFILIGLELPYVMRALRLHSLGTLLLYGGAVSGVLIVVRMLWVFPSAYIPPLFLRSGTQGRPRPPWRRVLFVGWAGIRGGDSLVIALALPFATAAGTTFPARDLTIFLTFSVIVATLVLQGMSLRPLLRWLGLREDGHMDAEESRARHAAAEAGLARLEQIVAREAADPGAVTYLRRTHREQLRRWGSRDESTDGTGNAAAERRAASYRELRDQMLEAERAAIVELRDGGEISDDALRRVQRELDLETMLLANSEDDAPESPYEAT